MVKSFRKLLPRNELWLHVTAKFFFWVQNSIILHPRLRVLSEISCPAPEIDGAKLDEFSSFLTRIVRQSHAGRRKFDGSLFIEFSKSECSLVDSEHFALWREEA
jgi:hypothetical protein